MTHPLEWDARKPGEKAKARRMIKKGTAKIIGRYHETYLSGKKLVNYEAWSLQLTENHPDYNPSQETKQ